MPRKLSQAKYRNNSIRINREGKRKLKVAINEWMAFTRKEAIKGLNKLIRKDQGQQIALELTDWEAVEAAGVLVIKPVILDIVQKAGQNTTELFNIQASFDIVNTRSVELAEQITARMVTEVTRVTQEGIAHAIRVGTAEGKSIPAIAKDIKPLVGLTENQIRSVANFEEQYIINNPTANQARIDRAANRFERKKHRERSRTIARTEASRTNAEGSLDVYEAEGVMVEWIAVVGNMFDPEFCQDNHGKVFTIGEAREMIPVHPNCECIWGPHVEIQAVAA